MLNKKSSEILGEIYFEEAWAKYKNMYSKLGIKKEDLKKRVILKSKQVKWITEEEAAIQIDLFKFALIFEKDNHYTFEEYEQNLSQSKRKKVNDIIIRFEKKMIEQGISVNFLSRTEKYIAEHMHTLRRDYLLGKKSGDLLSKFSFIHCLAICTLYHTKISPSIFWEAINSMKEKKIFENLDYETGLTGNPKYDRV